MTECLVSFSQVQNRGGRLPLWFPSVPELSGRLLRTRLTALFGLEWAVQEATWLPTKLAMRLSRF